MPPHHGFIQRIIMPAVTVFFDLDDTLLSTNMDRFLPGYFEILGKALDHFGTQDRITQQIQFAVQKMVANTDPSKTLKEVFDQHFYEPLGTTEEACKGILNTFYRDEFPHLKHITQTKPEASELVDWCQSKGMTMVIATNPLFPRTATHQRIQWAGLDPDKFSFFTTYDDFHFTKPNLTYYAEVFGRLGWPEGTAVMIGDSLTLDLLPMQTMGYETFWVNPNNQDSHQPSGTLSDVKPWLNKLSPNNQELSNHLNVNLAIIQSTPAVIDSWLRFSRSIQFLEYPSGKTTQFKSALLDLIYFEKEIFQTVSGKLKNNTIESLPYIENQQKDPWTPEPEHDILALSSLFITARKLNLALLNALLKNPSSVGNFSHEHQESKSLNGFIKTIAHHDRKLLRKSVNMLNNYKIY